MTAPRIGRTVTATTERIQALLDPSYARHLDAHSTDELRVMKNECTAVENALSYYRRLAQGRIEILDAELERRARGGSVEELIAKLPEILAGDGGRASSAQARLAEPETPNVEIEWPDNRQQLVNDSTLTELTALDDARVVTVRDQLHDFEREVSDLRQRLHPVLDGIEHEIATRQAAAAEG